LERGEIGAKSLDRGKNIGVLVFSYGAKCFDGGAAPPDERAQLDDDIIAIADSRSSEVLDLLVG